MFLILEIVLIINRMIAVFSLAFIIFLVYVVICFSKEIKKIVVEVYNQRQVNEVYLIFKKEFESELPKFGIDIDNCEQLNYLIQRVDEELEVFKPKPLIKTGIFVIVGPVWVAYSQALFDFFTESGYDTTKIYLATLIFLVVLTVVGSLYYLFYVMNSIIGEMIINSTYYNLSSLRTFLCDVKLKRMITESCKK